MSAHEIDQIRSFNRIVAEAIGAMDDRFLGRGRPMAESRVLWEIGPAGADLRDLRERLGLDSGYLSRVIGSLERQGLVAVQARPDDQRIRRACLTKSGLEESAELDRLSDAVALRVLNPLSEKQRALLVAAMSDVERLLKPSLVHFDVENPTSDDALACFTRYFVELNDRFESGFDPSLSLSADAHELSAPEGVLILGRLHGNPVGCVAVKLHGRKPAEIKRMWICASARGLGLGRQLLALAEQHARDMGARKVRLETNRALTEAIRLYRSAGYAEVPAFNAEPYAHHWFEKKLNT
jgi:DNA-binding MarR family transcriptional regulator/GNAT superfamily N-acetyltransferase